MGKTTKAEILIISLVLLVVGSLTYLNLQTSLRRARDFQRKEDVKNIANAIVAYHEDFGFYPQASADGKIVACSKEENKDKLVGLKNDDPQVLGASFTACDWGWDALGDLTDPNYPKYLPSIPTDPKNQDGYAYRYVSTVYNFQIFASLEGKDEAEYVQKIEDRGLICGVEKCNFGRGSPSTPLDKSLEEYENDIREAAEQKRQLQKKNVKNPAQ